MNKSFAPQIKSALNLTTSQFSSLYSCYSWPNLVLPVIGGFLIDSVFGLRLGTIIFSVFILLGQILLGVGALNNSLWFMGMARFCFGVGGESLNMALNTYTVAWFKDRELNMVFGFQLSISRVGSTVNFLVMEPLYSLLREHLDSVSALGWAFILAASITLISLLSSIILAFMDRRRERSGLRLVEAAGGGGGDHQKIRLTDIKQFPAAFWLLCLTTLAYYGSIMPFISLAQGLFKTEYNYTAQDANFIVGLVYLVSAIFSPVFGLLLDRFGRNLAWMCGSLAITGVAHYILAFTAINPYFPIVILGLAYSVLASALWSLPAVIVRQSHLATAFGIMQVISLLPLILIVSSLLIYQIFNIVCKTNLSSLLTAVCRCRPCRTWGLL